MWSYSVGIYVYGSAAVANGVVYIGAEDQNLQDGYAAVLHRNLHEEIDHNTDVGHLAQVSVDAK